MYHILNMSNVSEVDENDTIMLITAKDLTRELAFKVIPVTGLILTVAFLGICGNILILIVYSKYYRMSNFRYFVLCLAYIDLLSCFTTLPAEAHTQINWFTFRINSLCKIKSFLNVFTIFSSALTLFFLACDRYNKICHPFSRQIEPPLARRLCVIAVLVSAVMASPTAVLWGTQTYEVTTDNVTVSVQICEKSEVFADRLYPLVYIVTAFASPVCIIMVFTAFFNVMIVRKLVHGINTRSALTQDCQHLDSYAANGSDLQAVTEGVNTSSSIKIHSTCNNNSLKFWRHRSFPVVKCSARKKIHLCGRCHNCDPAKDVNVFDDKTVTEIRRDAQTNGISVKDTVHYDQRPHSYADGKCLEENGNLQTTSTSFNERRFIFKSRRNGHRKSLDGHLKYALNVNHKDSSNLGLGDIQAIFEENLRQGGNRRTSHLSEMDISKADSFTLQGLHRWRTWRQQALVRKSRNSRKKTFIMMILSSVFLLTMVIYFTLVILVADVDSVFRNMSSSKTVLFFFFWRLYFINSVINPVLYGLLDQRFRKGLTKLCCKRRLYS